MQLLKQSTSIKAKIGPFVDATDGVTPETGITLGAADQAELFKHDASAVTDISGRTWAAITGSDGWYNLTLTTTDTNTLGLLDVIVQDSSVCVPVHVRFMVVPANVWDSLFSTDKLQVHVDEMTSGIITADAIATDAIGSAELASTAVAAIADAVWDESTSGHTTAGTFGEQVKTDIDAILADTAVIGAAGAGLTAIPWNAAWDAEVQSEVNDGLVALGLDHLVSASVTGTDVVDNSIVAQLASKSATADWDSFDNATDALEAIADSSATPPTAAAIADAVWDEATSGHTTAGTFGEQVKTDIDAILADTAVIGAAGAGLTAIPWNAAWDAEVQSEVNDGLVALGLDHLVSASVTGTDVVDNSIVAQLASKSATADWDSFDNATDALEAIADSSATPPTAAAIADAVWDEATSGHTTAGTFGEQVKTDIDAILADTGTTIPGLIAALNDLSAAEVNAEVLDVVATDVMAELTQGVPPATPTLFQAVMLMYMSIRNLGTSSKTLRTITNDAGTVIAKATLADDGSTFTKAEFTSGP